MVVFRYALGFGSIRLQESVFYAHGGLFMLAAAWTLQIDGHVRVDIFYDRGSERARALVDLAGAVVFLLPTSLVSAELASGSDDDGSSSRATQRANASASASGRMGLVR